MRFSSLFHRDPPPPGPARPERAREEDAASLPRARPPAPAAQDLPDDLDQRVRLVGEWQLGEG